MTFTEASRSTDTGNDIVAALDVSAIEQEFWWPVSPRYGLALRLTIAIHAAILVPGPWIVRAIVSQPPLVLVALLSGLAAIVSAFLALVWASRRVRYTKYLLRERDVNLQKGCWWHQSTSVAINRIQHLEVTQGPIERALDLSRLHVFTAGGVRSDIVIPGLEIDTARQLKSHLLARVGNEEADGEFL